MTELAVGESRLVAGRYELEALIGKGGIAEVWRARHLALNSLVAIKFLQGASAQNESTRRRFTTEAQVTAQLKSQHAVQVFDFGVTEDGHPYLVMELLEGETLGRRIEREGRLGAVETARILGQSARALQKAHQLGIVHRDFKPDNIVIGHDDEGRDYVKVVDFGIAKLLGDLDPLAPEPDAGLAGVAPSASFTRTGAMLGTPYYMAPEQVRNSSDVDLRADIWAFGVVAFECLTGCTPFTGDTILELFDKIVTGSHPVADKLEPSIPPGFDEWFRAACAPDPALRFPDAPTAWRKLLEALDCGKVDLDPSLLRRAAASNDTPRVIVEAQGVVDGNAITIDATLKKGVEPRQRKRRGAGSEPPPPSAARGLPPEPPAVTRTLTDARGTKAPDASIDAPPTPKKSRGRRALLFAGLPLAAVAVFVWRASHTPPPSPAERVETAVAPTPTGPSASPASPSPSIAPAPRAAATTPPSEPTSSSSPPVAVVATRPGPRAPAAAIASTPPHGKTAAAPEPRAIPPAAPSAPSAAPTQPPASPPPPAVRPTPTAPDPESYR